ncbi:MAG: hypothetical protein M3Y64_11695 [Gemmatimonadota bacterium]|nr:hypothetical protein [Gemmatimonadota bacterium]
MINRHFSHKLLAGAALLLAVSKPLSAQLGAIGGAAHKLVRFSVSGGATLPSGDFKKTHDTGFHADGALLLNIPGFPFKLRPELSFTKLNFKPGAAASTATGDLSTQLLAGIGNIEVPLIMGLYVVGGAGAMNLKNNLGTTADSAQTRLVIDAGAGLRARIKQIDVFVEARVGSASYDKGKIGYAKAQFIPITFGLVF